MKSLATALAAAVLALLSAGAAGAATIYGVNEDWPKFAPDAGETMYAQLESAGLTQNVVSVRWDPAAPTEIEGRAAIAAAIAAAQAHGVRVVLAVYPAKARAVADAGVAGFVDYCEQVALAFPTVETFVVGNEPNQPRFWQPQFDARGRQASAAAFLPALAGCYDRLHPLGRKVIGVGLSPRGNDNPVAKSNISTSPVRFIAALGAAYRASGRSEPIMDSFSFHPYPNLNTDAPGRGYRWPNIGVPNVDRLKQALWDAFAGTGQPTPPDGLPIDLDEVGWQVDTQGLDGYEGRENVPTIDAETQARHHAEVVRRAACDPAIESLNFFHWIDEGDRDRFQSGEYLSDGITPRASAAAVQEAVAATGAGTRCVPPLTAATWRPATRVLGARVGFGSPKARAKPAPTTAFTFRPTAAETVDALYGIVRVAGPGALRGKGRSALEATLARTPTPPSVLGSTRRAIRAYTRPVLTLALRGLAPGWYVSAVSLRAQTNAERTAFFASRPFRVGDAAKGAA